MTKKPAHMTTSSDPRHPDDYTEPPDAIGLIPTWQILLLVLAWTAMSMLIGGAIAHAVLRSC